MKRLLKAFLRSIGEFLRRLFAAIRHVRTGGQSTRTAARRRAARPPRLCHECHQPIEHSDDWREHLNH